MAPNTHYAAKDRAPSARTVTDAVLMPELVTLWETNYRVYGVLRLWKTARRAGIDIGRDQTGRLMRAACIEGATRSGRVKTTRPNPTAARHPDLVKREFTATAPNRLWVTDSTFVTTRAGIAYVCFIIDVYSRMIVGAGAHHTCAPRWSLTRSKWPVEAAALTTRICAVDSGAGSQFTSIRCGERLVDIGATPSIGTVGDIPPAEFEPTFRPVRHVR